MERRQWGAEKNMLPKQNTRDHLSTKQNQKYKRETSGEDYSFNNKTGLSTSEPFTLESNCSFSRMKGVKKYQTEYL